MVTCKYCAILHKRPEHPQIFVSWGKGGFQNQATAYVSGRTVLAEDTPDKGLSSKIHKEL